MSQSLNKATKILFAPHEIGGQMQLMVQELRHRGYFATAATYQQEWFGHVNDIHLNLPHVSGKINRHLRLLAFTLWAAQNYDIFHFFWGESLYGLGRFPHLDLWLLRRLNKQIFVHFRGLDIIDLAYFDYLRARTAGDHLPEPPINRPDQRRSLTYWRRYGDKMLVSEPDLLRVVPEAVLVQQAVDLDYWCPSPSQLVPQSEHDGIIRIAHAPSMRRKKGTEFVEQAVSQLQREGLKVELVLIERVPFHQVKALYESCDIGIDQVLYGWYGKVSIELMALRRPVVCYIDPQWLCHRPDMPIINATPSTLTTHLRELVKDAGLRKRLGDAGIDYARRYHDVKVIVDQCLQIYQQTAR